MDEEENEPRFCEICGKELEGWEDGPLCWNDQNILLNMNLDKEGFET